MVRSFSFTLLITWILITLSCKTTFISSDVKTKNISVDNNINAVDSQLVKIYLPLKNIIEKDMNRVISFSKEEMKKNKPESSLTNFLSDLLLYEGQKEAEKNNLQIHPVVSFFNYGGIRTSLPKGEITVGKIFELMPFENEMVYIQLTGDQLQQFCDIVAQNGGDGVGGVRFVISNGKAKNVVVDGQKPEPGNNYWLVTNDYSANGGDNLAVFTHRSELIGSGKKIRDVIISNLEERQKRAEVLVANLDGRISNE